MRVLQIASRIPIPPDDGGKVAVYHTTRHYAGKGWDVHFAAPRCNAVDDIEFSRLCTLHALDVDPRNRVAGMIKNLFESTPYVADKYYSERAFQQLVEIMQSEKFDIIQVEMLHMGSYAIKLKSLFHLKILLCQQNYQTAIIERYAEHARNPLVKMYALRQARRMKTYESDVVSQFDQVISLTPEDDARLRAIAPAMKSTIIPIGVDLDAVHFSAERVPGRVLFMTNLEWFPNKDSFNYYLEEIEPHIRANDPSIRTVLVGKQTSEWQSSDKSLPLDVHGFVPDINEIPKFGTVAVVPLRIGSGMRVKIIELMAMGCTVITTTIGCEGIKCENGKHLIVCDDPKTFAEKVIYYVRNPAESLKIAFNARRLVEERYSSYAVGEQLSSILSELVKGTT